MRKGFLIVGWGLCLAILFPHGVVADDGAKKLFAFYWENDVFAGTDRDYSNGLRLSWSKPYRLPGYDSLSFTDKVIDYLPWVNDPFTRRNIFFTVGQNIYTPADTKTSELIEDDRPYAGFLYTTFGAYADKDNRRSVWEFDIGVVGSLSMAEQTQNTVHDIINTSKAAGWEHQLENELTLGAAFETSWRLWQRTIGKSFGVQLIPHIGGHIGNVAVYANTGAELRFGRSLPNNFGTCPIRPGCDSGELLNIEKNEQSVDRNRWGAHFFVSINGRAVLHNMFLDGNTFSDSHSVTRESFLCETMIGMAFHYNSLQVSYAYVQLSKEFEEQEKAPAFGAIKISFVY